LAPYFFPLYVVLVVGCLFWDTCSGVGRATSLVSSPGRAAYAFHITLTWHILQTRQSDITSQGYFFFRSHYFPRKHGVLLIGRHADESPRALIARLVAQRIGALCSACGRSCSCACQGLPAFRGDHHVDESLNRGRLDIAVVAPELRRKTSVKDARRWGLGDAAEETIRY